MVENPAFIGSIFDVLVGIILVDFIEILIKSIKSILPVLKYLILGEK